MYRITVNDKIESTLQSIGDALMNVCESHETEHVLYQYMQFFSNQELINTVVEKVRIACDVYAISGVETTSIELNRNESVVLMTLVEVGEVWSKSQSNT